jgi:N-acetylated-alpha-linked acidic dipeptidase
MRIPVIPISYADAKPFLAALEGPIAPPHWSGSLPITYHVGPGKARVHLEVVSDWSLKTIYDVVAFLRGDQQPDHWILRGNHHDAWVFGAWDPLAGQVALMAEAKAFGALAQQGWKPKRTLVYTSWDAEEPGLIGSTEWAETHAGELQKKAVLYVNSDTNGRGFLNAGGSHALQRLVNEVASKIKDPETNATIQERLRAKLIIDGEEKDAKKEKKKNAELAEKGGDLPISALGSGSDFTPFLQHLGIATLSLEYGGEDQDYGIYHSAYDSYDHYLRFGDPKFVYGITLAETIGHTLLQVAESDVLPFQFTDFAETIDRYLVDLHTLCDETREETQKQAKFLDSGAYVLAADPEKHLLPPERKTEVPSIDLTPLSESLKNLKKSASSYDAALHRAQENGFSSIRAEQIAALNQLLQGIEQTLLSGDGLPGREWFRHLIYAPGMNTGYDVKTLPGIREAIEARQWNEAIQYVGRTAACLDAYRDRIDKATSMLEDSAGK